LRLLGSLDAVRAIDDTTRDLLADTWERWARRCSELTSDEWSAPTRCAPWDVHALVAHACPELSLFDLLNRNLLDTDAAVSDGASMLRTFNAPGGAAHTTAGDLAQTALSEAVTLRPADAVTRFNDCARAARAVTLPGQSTISYPVVGSATLAAVADVALVESTVHLLDLVDAVGGVGPSTGAVEATRDVLIAIPDPTAAVEILAGRVTPSCVLPVIR
jgi:uncharacterized protein (TIGR03083 family)